MFYNPIRHAAIFRSSHCSRHARGQSHKEAWSLARSGAPPPPGRQLLHWMPDFLLADGTYIEIKGYVTAQAQAKFEFFYRPLRVLTKAELQPMFEYVERTYGRNFVSLYE